MRFQLFGIPTEVHFGFWLMVVFLRYGLLAQEHKFLILVWALVVFLSILVHELGHAFAMLRYGLQPAITLYAMGGLTGAHGLGRLTRGQQIVVSFAGPFAGFMLGGLVYLVRMALPSLGVLQDPQNITNAQIAIAALVSDLLWVNFAWGVMNLIPALPLDGGHILEAALGPRRERLAAMISLGVGAAVALAALAIKEMLVAIIFAGCALTSLQRMRAAEPAAPARPRSVPPEPEEAAEVMSRVVQAQAALDDDRYREAATLAELALNGTPTPKPATRMALLHLIAWSALLDERIADAERALRTLVREGEPDPALAGAILFRLDRIDEARKLLETARAAGDDRKVLIGPLIQILIRQGEIARAAAIALDIVETLSEEDARQMAKIAFEHECYPWASRLSEAVFERSGQPDDAYDAARSRSLAGDAPGALAMLRRAVAAGFSDGARAWSDKALEAVRRSEEKHELEHLLKRPAAD
jgi:Zn-dependent protease